MARRDIRFHWSDSTYVADDVPLVPDTTLANDLSQLGTAFAKTKLNPFGYDLPDIQLVHDYFHPGSATYNVNPDADGFLLPRLDPPTYTDGDRNHIDLYVYYPQIGSTNWGDGLPWPENTGNRGRHPSDFMYAGEDVAEGRPAIVDSASIRHGNSISLAGPRSDQVGQNTWGTPNGGANWVFAHEFAHAMAGPSEIIASAAEALAGETSETPIYDHPYNELLFDGGNGNYTAWRSFSAYLVYNFRGMDRSYGGRSDDLIWRWARNQGFQYGITGLATELIGANCLQCSLTTSRFAGLTPIERVGRLVQDWRVANYVNNPALADSQYGFPSHLFNPVTEVGNWTDRDGLASNNGTTLPPEWTVTPAWASPRWFSYRPAGTGFAARQLALKNVSGSEYFVFHADPALDGSRDLEVRVVSDAIVRSESYTGGCSPVDAARGVLWVSAVRYAEDDSSLFLHPEHATEVLNTRIVLDSLRSGATLLVPGFGSSTRAVVVVATLWREGTMRTFAPLVGGAAAPIAIQARLRPAQSSAPVRIVATAGQHDDAPAWSANGNEIAFASKIPSTVTYSQIYRVSSAGGTPVALAAASRNQRNPDWSPRGDFVVYEQDAPGLSKSDIWIHDLSADTSAALISKARAATHPAFQPNGRMVAYRYSSSASAWQIRKVGVDGSGDSLVVELSTAPQSLRWSPDGLWLWYSVRDTITGSPEEVIDVPYVVSRNGGTPTKREDLVETSRGALSIALHPSGSSALCEQTGQTYWGILSCSYQGCGCPFPSEALAPVQVRRVQMRDLVTADAIMPFQDVPTGRQYFPRFAPDGIRIAYSQNDSNATSMDRDIIVRKLGDHSAPVFSSPPGDLTLESGPGTAIDLDATDPDGLAITYQGVQLPAGSWINSVSGVFSWPQPAAGAVAYPVLRGLDAAGGVATVIPRLTIAPGFAPSAVGDLVGDVTTSSAILMTWMAPGDDTTSGAATQYEIRWSQSAITENNFAAAHPVDAPAPQVAGTWQTQWVTGLQANTYYYLAIRARDEAHNWSPISVVYSRTAQSGGGGGGESAQNTGDRLELAGAPRGRTTALGATAGSAVAAETGPPIALEVRMTDGVPLLSIHRSGVAVNGLAIEALNGSGTWTRLAVAADPGVGALTVRQRRDGARRYILPCSYSLSRIATSVATGNGAGLELTAAENSRTGALEPATDLQSPAMETGDTLRASYAITESASARAEDWLVLLTRGAAASANRSEQTASVTTTPVSFALHQSQPNPFSRDVTIAFDLPRESPVRIEVHDLQGRLVAQLANATLPAGRHSVAWNRAGRSGALMAPGVYLYSMTAGTYRAQRKMIALP